VFSQVSVSAEHDGTRTERESHGVALQEHSPTMFGTQQYVPVHDVLGPVTSVPQRQPAPVVSHAKV
jgi:hypothetical protein